MTENSEKIVLGALVSLGLLAVLAIVNFLVTLIAWPLWNWIACSVLGLPYFSYMQTWGFLLLCSILFKTSIVQNNKQ